MERKLISIVRKYPELYDREHSNYQELKLNKALWGEVGKEMRLPGDDCQIVWRRLKRNYLHSINKKRSGEDCSVDYENEMQFLKTFYEESSASGYIPECSDEEDDVQSEGHRREHIRKNINDSKKKGIEEIDVISISESDSCNEISDIEMDDNNGDSDSDVIFNDDEDINNGRIVEESLHSTIVKFKDKSKLTKAMRRDIKDLQNKYKHVDIKKLISLVEKKPPLYDIRRQEYHHFRGKKSTLWEKIARNMNCSANECSKTWHIIKKFYFDYLENTKDGNKTCWLYEKDMTFLYPIYVEKIQRTKAMLEAQIEKPSIQFVDENRIEFDRRVIEAVKMFPALYNTQHADYFRYRNNKDSFWEKVAIRINAPVDFCRRSWGNSKKTYLHYLERELETNTIIDWRFKKELAFLKPICDYKRNVVDLIDLSVRDQNDERKDLERKIVHAVHKYPPLFDIRIPEFVNLQMKKGLMWSKVAAEVNCPVEECRKIWRALVTCYLQFLRRKQSGTKSCYNWRLEKEMSYLKPVYNGSVPTPPVYSMVDFKEEENHSAEDRLKFKIIHTVRKYPVLYDVKHPDFVNTRNKNIPIWIKISKELGCRAEQCRDIWNDLRRMYISYEKRKAAGARVAPWKFARAMSFYDLLIGENGKIARAFDTRTGEIIYRDNRRDFERQLIELVKNCPQLYDYRREDYIVTTDISQRKMLWAEIGKKLNATGQECSTTWRNLKKFYVSSIQRPVPGESPLGRKWKFKDEMKFLLPLYKNNKRHYTRVRIEDTDDSSMNMSCNEYTSDDASSNAAVLEQRPLDLRDGAAYASAFGENFFQNCEEFEGYAGIYVKAEYTDCETICAELNEYNNMRSLKNGPSGSKSSGNTFDRQH